MWKLVHSLIKELTHSDRYSQSVCENIKSAVFLFILWQLALRIMYPLMIIYLHKLFVYLLDHFLYHRLRIFCGIKYICKFQMSCNRIQLYGIFKLQDSSKKGAKEGASYIFVEDLYSLKTLITFVLL